MSIELEPLCRLLRGVTGRYNVRLFLKDNSYTVLFVFDKNVVGGFIFHYPVGSIELTVQLSPEFVEFLKKVPIKLLSDGFFSLENGTVTLSDFEDTFTYEVIKDSDFCVPCTQSGIQLKSFGSLFTVCKGDVERLLFANKAIYALYNDYCVAYKLEVTDEFFKDCFYSFPDVKLYSLLSKFNLLDIYIRDNVVCGKIELKLTGKKTELINYFYEQPPVTFSDIDTKVVEIFTQLRSFIRLELSVNDDFSDSEDFWILEDLFVDVKELLKYAKGDKFSVCENPPLLHNKFDDVDLLISLKKCIYGQHST